MNKGEIAANYFLKGYTCSQAVILAFKEYINIPTSDLLKISYPFGGGISRLREACGSFTSSVMIIGYLFNDDSINIKKKTELYLLVQEFAEIFKKENGFINCRDLLGLNKNIKEDNKPAIRNETYYKTRPCLKIISSCANALDKFLKDKKLI